eukprot:4152406-Amphidinium_carterae.1
MGLRYAWGWELQALGVPLAPIQDQIRLATWEAEKLQIVEVGAGKHDESQDQVLENLSKEGWQRSEDWVGGCRAKVAREATTPATSQENGTWVKEPLDFNGHWIVTYKAYFGVKDNIFVENNKDTHKGKTRKISYPNGSTWHLREAESEPDRIEWLNSRLSLVGLENHRFCPWRGDPLVVAHDGKRSGVENSAGTDGKMREQMYDLLTGSNRARPDMQGAQGVITAEAFARCCQSCRALLEN